MSQPKPKLLIVGPASISAEDLRKKLGDQFDVVFDRPQPDAAVATEPRHPAETLLDAIPDAVGLIDAAGAEIWTSARFAGLPHAVLDRVRACYPEAIATLLRPHRPASRAAATCKFDLASTEDGTSHEVFIFAAPQTAPHASEQPQTRLAVVVRDVSTDRQFEDRLAAIERAGAELVDIDADVI
ncbi:MAG: hypothetical protein ACF8LK_05035, partial [Phycisphaerales bacterium JB041]